MPKPIVLFDLAGDKILKIKFSRERKHYKIPDEVKVHLKEHYKQRGKDPTNNDARHIIAAEIIFKYWERNLKRRSLKDAEDIVKARIDQLVKEAKEVDPKEEYTSKKQYVSCDPNADIEKRQSVFKENLQKLMFLEITSHKNLFYGDSSVNQQSGGKFGAIRKALRDAFRLNKGSKHTFDKLQQQTLDLGTDDKKKHWGVSDKKFQEAKVRFNEIYKVAFFIISGHPKRGQYDPNQDESSEDVLRLSQQSRISDINDVLSSVIRNPNDKDQLGNGFLHDAIAKGDTDTVKFLLKLDGINVDLQNNKGETPLHIAAGQENQELIELLLAHRAKPYIKNAEDEIPWDLVDDEELEKLLDPENKRQRILIEDEDELSESEEKKQDSPLESDYDLMSGAEAVSGAVSEDEDLSSQEPEIDEKNESGEDAMDIDETSPASSSAPMPSGVGTPTGQAPVASGFGAPTGQAPMPSGFGVPSGQAPMPSGVDTHPAQASVPRFSSSPQIFPGDVSARNPSGSFSASYSPRQVKDWHGVAHPQSDSPSKDAKSSLKRSTGMATSDQSPNHDLPTQPEKKPRIEVPSRSPTSNPPSEKQTSSSFRPSY